MTSNSDDSSDCRTFSERYGYEPLPQPMRLGEISDDLRREIWNKTRELFQSRSRPEMSSSWGSTYFVESETGFIERVLGKFLKKPEDEIDTSYTGALAHFKTLILKSPFNVVLDLIEEIANHKPMYAHRWELFARIIRFLFDKHAAAYWLDESRRPYHFFPRSSREQGEATQQSIQTIREADMKGASTHLRQAVEQINVRQFAKSIADSIHAVESVARQIDPESQTLRPALNSLKKAGLIKHPALKEAFSKLYGYTSDEQGIRHALLNQDSADVGVDEAIFMFGACASFAAYLVNKHRQMQGQEDRDQ